MEIELQNKRKMNAAISSVVAAVFLTVTKLIFALLTGSLGILSEFAHSGLDLFAAIVTVFSIKISNKPADEDHQYGHGKIENLSAMAQVVILLVTCGYITYEAIERLFFRDPILNLEYIKWSYIVMIIAIIVDFSRSKMLKKVALETHSQALEADALHFSTDIWSSTVVIIGLIFVSFNISKGADAIAALVVCVFVIYVSARLLRKAIDQLMDRVPEGLYDNIINEVKEIDGVEGIKFLRLRESGPKTFIDMTIYISRTAPFQKVHDIMDAVEDKIKNIKSTSDVTIHSEPVETERETIMDKVRLIVNRHGLKCHDIFTYIVDEENYIELDVEYITNDNFTDAHKEITKIEDEIYKEIKGISKVMIHIDEPSDLILKSENVSEEKKTLIKQISDVINSNKDIIGCTDINIIKSSNKLRISMTCIFSKELEFSHVHRLAHKMESDIYLISDDIGSVMIHAEPAKQ